MFKIPRSTPFIKDALGPRRLSQIWQIWYILVGGLKVTYSYQVLKNGLEDVTNDVRDCPGGGPCYVLVYVGLEAGLVTQSEDSLFCPQQKWTFHLFLHFDSADF